MDLSRREILRLGTLGTLAAALPRWVFSEDPAPAVTANGPRARRLIYLYMAGGMSHLDTFDPKAGRPEQGNTGVIPTSVDGVTISEHLPGIAKRLHHCALIRSVTSTQGAHEQGDYLMHTGFQARGTTRHPSAAAWVSALQGKGSPNLPTGVIIGGSSRHPGGGFFAAEHAPIPLGDPSAGLPFSKRPDAITVERYRKRMALLKEQDAAYLSAYDAPAARTIADLHGEAVKLMEAKDLAAFDLSKEPAAAVSAYGDSTFGRGCCLARRLIEHDVRTVEVTLGGWDMHDDIANRLEGPTGTLDRAVSALLDDLHVRGLLDETLVMITSEFGRTPAINQNHGRDHHPKVFSVLMAGGGIRGGRIHGESDERGFAPGRAAASIPDVVATMGYALGMPLDQVVHSPDGRPFTFADHGKPLTGLFA